jgi:hypothetical protein
MLMEMNFESVLILYVPVTDTICMFIYLFNIHVHVYSTKLGNPLDVEQVRVRNTYTHINDITAIK